MCKSVEGINGWKGQMLDWVVWASRVAIVGLFGIMGWAWWDHEERIDALALAQQATQANRFTSADGLGVWREIAEIRAALDNKADAIGAVPVREDIQELKERVIRLERQLTGR